MVADLAYNLWLSAAFNRCLPEQAFFSALRIVKGKSSAGLFLVPGRRPTIRPIAVAKSVQVRVEMKTLLVLEDEPLVMKLLRHMLKQYTIVEATRAEQALRLFNDHAQQIDLLLADVTLPVSSGIQVALVLRSKIPNLPVILASGYPVDNWSEQDANDLKRLDSRSLTILQKPTPPKQLLSAVAELIGVEQAEKVRTARPSSDD
ncbi:MAG: response regulator [Ignavibacteriota bacterium]